MRRGRNGRKKSDSRRRRIVERDELARTAPFCTVHGKRTYRSRKVAERKAKDRTLIVPEPGKEINAYPCDVAGATGWHIGHRRMGPWPQAAAPRSPAAAPLVEGSFVAARPTADQDPGDDTEDGGRGEDDPS